MNPSGGTAPEAALTALVRGRVQGVYFRDFVARRARRLGLKGYVRNLSDGVSVEVYAEGSKPLLEELLTHLWQGPPHARVETVEETWTYPQGRFFSFDIAP